VSQATILRVSRAPIIMISFRLRNSSDGFDAILVQNIRSIGKNMGKRFIVSVRVHKKNRNRNQINDRI
jgi:hypothetical protein